MRLAYHYTNTAGLLGILGEKHLWMRHTRYMNDTTECSLFPKEVLKLLELEADQFFAEFVRVKFIADTLDHYVVSLCEDDNLLSMWRNYAGREDGFCLGFERDRLAVDAEAIGLDGQIKKISVGRSAATIPNCEYGEEVARERATNWYRSLQERYQKWIENFSPTAEEKDPIGIDKGLWKVNGAGAYDVLIDDYGSYKYRIKHECFSEERELRWVIAPRRRGQNLDCKSFVRAAPGFFQYLRLPFKVTALKSITLSPFSRPEIVPGLRQYLQDNGFSHVAVTQSRAHGIVR